MKYLASLVALATVISLPVHAQVAEWGQCGGIGWNGGTTCASPWVCTKLNDYYFQCLPASTTVESTPHPSSTPITTTITTPGQPSQSSSPPPPPPPPPPPTGTGLDALFKRKSKVYFGTASDSNRFSDATDSSVTIANFGGLTPENSMKWDATEPSQNQFSFSGSDALVAYAQQHSMVVRAHTLVWHSQLPSWVSAINSKTTLTSVIQNHISNLAGRYKGKVRSWDVVNEIFNEDGSLRQSVFSTVLGQSFVNIAFTAARAADPNAILYINDYNLDSPNAKVNGLVSLVNQVNGGGAHLIDGIGTQCHLNAGGAGQVQAALQSLAGATGITEVAITELDIVNAAANDYTTVVKACLAVSKCVSITVWGVSDKDSWRASSNPLLFDGNFKPKPAETAIVQLLSS